MLPSFSDFGCFPTAHFLTFPGQTYKGKALYECDMVAVITTSTLTAQAEGEAKQLGIKVWGRGKIRQLMSKLDNADDYYLSA